MNAHRAMRHTVWILLLLAAPSPAQRQDWFEYDPSAPLDYRETLISTRAGVRIYDSSYASPKGGRVRAYTVAPDRKGRFAGIVWQHGGGQNRNWFLPDAIALAQAGAISILMDAPSNRPPEMRGSPAKDNVEDFQHEMIQVVVDARRAYDALAARPEVDKDRIGYAGLSFGAMMGGSLAGTDKRFKSFVLICGLEGFVRHYRVSQHPGIVQFRNNMKPEEFQRFLAAAEPIDAKNFIGKSSPKPLLFQAARFDIGVSESDTRDYFAMAGEPKELKWYDSGHDLNDPQAFADRQAWFRKYLNIK
jgi:cephalosporin-C deacetylase-like acetyl esterase